MIDKEAFLLAIKDNWTDFTLRKVYADYLEENGDEEEAIRQRNYEELYKESYAWLEEFAEGTGEPEYDEPGDEPEYYYDEPGDEPEYYYEKPLTVQDLIEIAMNYEESGDRHVFGFTQHATTDEDFWTHMEVVSGIRCGDGDASPNIFSCAC